MYGYAYQRIIYNNGKIETMYLLHNEKGYTNTIHKVLKMESVK